MCNSDTMRWASTLCTRSDIGNYPYTASIGIRITAMLRHQQLRSRGSVAPVDGLYETRLTSRADHNNALCCPDSAGHCEIRTSTGQQGRCCSENEPGTGLHPLVDRHRVIAGGYRSLTEARNAAKAHGGTR